MIDWCIRQHLVEATPCISVVIHIEPMLPVWKSAGFDEAPPIWTIGGLPSSGKFSERNW